MERQTGVCKYAYAAVASICMRWCKVCSFKAFNNLPWLLAYILLMLLIYTYKTLSLVIPVNKFSGSVVKLLLFNVLKWEMKVLDKCIDLQEISLKRYHIDTISAINCHLKGPDYKTPVRLNFRNRLYMTFHWSKLVKRPHSVDYMSAFYI